MNKENLHIREYIDLVKLALEKEFSIKLQIDFRLLSKEFTVFDLADTERHFYVEVVPLMKSLDINRIIQKVNNQKEILQKLYSNEKASHILVFQNTLSIRDKNTFDNALLNNSIQQFSFDNIDIKNMANQPELKDDEKVYTEYQKLTGPKISSKKIDHSKVEKPNNIKTENEILEFRNSLGLVNYFVAGHLWNGVDQLSRFIDNKIWENGHETNDTNAVNSVSKGDIIFIKSTFANQGISFLRVKGIGLVIDNKNDGHNLEVNWYIFDKPIDIENLGKYRRTFARVKSKDVEQILSSIFNNIPNFLNIFSLLYSAVFKDSLKNKNVDANDEDRVRQLIKDTLNAEYKLNLVIELTRVLYGSNIKFDLSDDKAKTFAVILKKEDFSDVPTESKYKPGSRDERIMLNIYSKIIADIDLLFSGNNLDKYFAFFDESFTDKDVTQFKIWLTDNYNKVIEVLRLSDIIKLSDKNNIRNNDIKIGNNKSTEDSQEDNESINSDKIPFHLDNVETIDRLNREPVAKSLARLINNEIFSSKDLNHSFMIHLQGEWGSGKSTFLNLLEKNLDTSQKKWIVIKYNAWQNQHILPPWWSFIDQIYQQSKPKFNWFFDRPGLRFRENIRRVIWYSGWHKIMTLVISLIFGCLLLAYGKSLITVVSELPSTENIDNKTKGLTLEVFAKLIVSVGSVIGLIYSLSKFLSTPFLMKSSGEAKSFLLRASDPMNRIKTHFNDLISNINDQGYQIAVFIDDIDRCNKAYTVNLLEGIQTLFKDKKVLYVVAGDKNWISTCFENNYKEFIDKVSRNNEQLGDLFLEKAFQLSVRMPNVSERTKQKYWHHILGVKESELDKKTKLSDNQKIELKQKIARNIKEGKFANPEVLKSLEDEFNASEQDISDIAIETFDEKNDDIKHLFIDHFALINPNPRSIKRLANNYTMYRNTLVAERKEFDPNKLFRWLIIDDMYPVLSKQLLHLEKEIDIDTYINSMNLNNAAELNLNKLLFDKENKHGSKIEISDIKDILGL
ncbi:P-loop NTPase fold protein [Olleya sp. R77988]|uniref:KAP family P-loop NTPase fold protein n=1 Tax=Olleya sp. R77988 TaxID=3093875 RepID=UPI0037CC221E